MLKDVEIRNIVKIAAEGCCKATITFRVGPIIVRGSRLMEKDGQRWLALPSRKMKNGNWANVVTISSLEDKKQLEKLACQAYERSLEEETIAEFIPAF